VAEAEPVPLESLEVDNAVADFDVTVEFELGLVVVAFPALKIDEVREADRLALEVIEADAETLALLWTPEPPVTEKGP
jgi:hypothetical protein